MISIKRLAPESDPESDGAAPEAIAEDPSCYSVTIFTQRWKEVRDFYVEILHARVLSERTDFHSK